MKKLDLNGSWRFKKIDEQEWKDAVVPGSVYADLLRLQEIEDPFYRDNEKKIRELSKEDFVYEKEIQIEADFLKNDAIYIECEGLDTIAEIYVNHILLQTTRNMHRKHRIQAKEALIEGRNTIQILFRSPVRYITEKQNEYFLWGLDTNMVMEGHAHIRKAHYMFGWDWGPQIPDMGIWRSISLIGSSGSQIEDVLIRQSHGMDGVELNICAECTHQTGRNVSLEILIHNPMGEMVGRYIKEEPERTEWRILLEQPLLWWPNGYGKQSLYHVQISLYEDEVCVDEYHAKIGLRTIEVQHPIEDEEREGFQFVINGIPIFAMGANYIPEDNILSRCSKAKTKRLISDCVAAHYNCLRVWGGGIYPEDYFYELCDQYGILVWQDFGFACTVYHLDDSFREEITKEAVYNIKRYRHHASLALWCGNNEVEVAHTGWVTEENCSTNIHHLKADYIKIFEFLLPELVKTYSPETSYWPSSPSSTGSFDNPEDMKRGDMHFWKVWHGQAPIRTYRQEVPFVSEFGFLSLPDWRTICSFTEAKDRVFGSYIFDEHEKCKGGNNKSLLYVLEEYKYPNGLQNIIYLMQCMQGEALKCGVEYWRAHRGRCMGALYWQVNDCWPVASWSSIDNYGRWKAAHYYAKRFFNPILLSAQLDGEEVEIFLSNESREETVGNVTIRLRTNHSEILYEKVSEVSVAPLTSQRIETLIPEKIRGSFQKNEIYLEYFYEKETQVLSRGTLLFVPVKYFELLPSTFQTKIKEKEESFEIILEVSEYARQVELKLKETDCIFSDNYFDVSKGERIKIEIEKKTMERVITLEELHARLRIKSVADSY